jgi:hypothetical protein
MYLTITALDFGPQDLYEQLPIVVDLFRSIPGDDRPDYWLGAVKRPIRWQVKNQNRVRDVTHLVVVARWTGTTVEFGAENLPIGIAYVTDESVLDDAHLDFAKCAYVAIGTATEALDGRTPKPREKIRAGSVAPAFGTGKAAVLPYARSPRDLAFALMSHLLMTLFWLLATLGVGESISLPASASVLRVAASYLLVFALPALWVIFGVMLVVWWREDRGPLWSYPLRWGLGLAGTFFTLIALCFPDVRAWFIPPRAMRNVTPE